MMNITVRSWGATALGAGCAALTARVIVDDVVSAGAPVTISHMMSVTALVVTIASGHHLGPQLKAGRVLIALGLMALFAAGTVYCVTIATMRNAETTALKAASIRQANEQRAAFRFTLQQAEADLADAKKALAQAEAEAARECGSGKGKKCDGRETTRSNAERARDRAQSHVDLIGARIAILGPERRENGSFGHVAHVWVTLFGGDEARVTDVLVMILPVVTTLITEAATIVFLAMGLGHPDTTSKRNANDPVPPPDRKLRRTKRDPKIVNFVTAFRAKNGRDPSLPEMRTVFPELPKTTAQRYRRTA